VLQPHVDIVSPLGSWPIHRVYQLECRFKCSCDGRLWFHRITYISLQCSTIYNILAVHCCECIDRCTKYRTMAPYTYRRKVARTYLISSFWVSEKSNCPAPRHKPENASASGRWGNLPKLAAALKMAMAYRLRLRTVDILEAGDICSKKCYDPLSTRNKQRSSSTLVASALPLIECLYLGWPRSEIATELNKKKWARLVIQSDKNASRVNIALIQANAADGFAIVWLLSEQS